MLSRLDKLCKAAVSVNMCSLPNNWEDLSQVQQLATLFHAISTSGDKVNKLFESLSQEFKSLKTTLNEYAESLRGLKYENSLLRSEINELKESRNTTPSSEMKVSGIPRSCTLPLNDIACAILKCMGLESLCNDIIEVRPFNINSDIESTKSDNGITIPTFSFIVKFKSCIVRDHVLKTKRKLGAIKYCDIYTGIETPSSSETVALYEMLPKSHHNLRLLIKERAKKYDFKYVWTREGNTYVRKNDESERIAIFSQSDLSKIK